MSDNTRIFAGTDGDTISTDELSDGTKVQRVKAQYGPDGSATDVSEQAPLPVNNREIVTLLQYQLAWLKAISFQLSQLHQPPSSIQDISPFLDLHSG